MVGNWWHLAQTPDGVHARQFDPTAIQAEAEALVVEDPELTHDEAVAELLAARAEAHRAELGFPPNGRWVNRPQWDSSLTEGEPHPTFLARATVSREA